ncbi:restriction endonuclease subunit S [Listeria monocytogenes]|nr:restriction endonuclease subunit S [Listeria monocytogenes]
MSHINKKVPKRRFQEFNNTDDWEQRKLGENAVIKGRLGWKSLKQEEYRQDGPSMIAGKHIKKGEIDWRKVDHIPIWRYEESPEIKLKNGDVIFSKDGSLGNPALITNLREMATINSTMMLVRTDNTIDSEFFYQIMTSDIFKKLVYIKVSGSSIPHLFQSDMKNFQFHSPTVEEQQKIGSFFKQLDNTIALHQRKLEKIKALKTAYLSEMFPAEGETKPKRRFAGFTDDWEQHKLGDLIDKQIKGKAQLEKLSEGTVSYLDTFTLNGGKALLTDGHEDVVETDILILWDGSKAGTVYIGFKGALGSTLKGYRTSINEQFVYQFLKYNQENIYNNYRTPNIPHVQKDFLDVFKISIPKSVEQAKLGSFFKQFDNIITLHQRKLQKLQNIKKAYLNEMFI